jgi:hypothetical protein
MIQYRSVPLLALLLGLASACGGDDEEDDSAARLASCKQACDAVVEANCQIAFPADTCKDLCDVYAQTSVACQQAIKATSDCQLAQADVCDTSACSTEQQAAQQACG